MDKMSDHRPMMVVDGKLQLQWCCDRSRALLGKPLPLRIRGDKLVVEDELSPGRFSRFIKTLDKELRRFIVRGRSTPHWAMLRAWRSPAYPSLSFMVANLSVPHRAPADSGMAEDLGLTRAETVVLAEFAYLKSPKEIAADLGISLSTVRSHLKQIYAKASVQTGLQLFLLVRSYDSI